MSAKPTKQLAALGKFLFRKESIAVIMLVIAISFFRSERKELHAITPHLQQAHTNWLVAGLVITVLYILAQAGIYSKSFAAIGLRLSRGSSIGLFLKRNFISVFLPAGSISALAYSPSQIRKAGFTKTQVYQAGALFGFAGLITVVLAGMPVIVLSLFRLRQAESLYSITGLLLLVMLITVLWMTVRSIRRKGHLYQWLQKHFPAVTPQLDDIFNASVNQRQFSAAIGYSLVVEVCGMVHIYIGMLALGLPASLPAAATAYIAAVLMMVVSPFLKGLGAVEISLVYVLAQFGYAPVQALSIMVLFRVFEFWLPLLAGLFAFAWKGRKLFLRTAPALLIFTLGMVNIISVVLPPIRHRMHVLRAWLPLDAIHASNFVVLITGLVLILTSAFLLRGLRNAWILALVLTFLSFIGNLTKALDYEEAIIAAITMVTLVATGEQYRVRTGMKWKRKGSRVSDDALRQQAQLLLSRYGDSAVDYFKGSKDKLLFFSEKAEGFIAYRVAGGFAIVLEEPVCAEEHKSAVLAEFDRQCRKLGLKTAFYRVNEDSMTYFRQFKKQKLMIGQEGILDIRHFSLEGRDKKSLRNGLNNLQKKGYTTTIHTAPQTDGLLASLRTVSDNWLAYFTREEMIFSQGMFDTTELKQQDLITVTDPEGKPVAFLNIISDYAADECTYDLIRKTADAPGAVADALILKLIDYAREHNKQFINLGMVPLTGNTRPDNTAEQLLGMVSARVKRFREYQGLRAFKEKYATGWENKYLVYEHDFDLLQLPHALKKVMQPVLH